MDLCEFGLLPYQLFNKDFPSKNLKDLNKNNLNNLNLELFNEEHINQIKSPLDCFICKGSNLINNSYIQIMFILIDEKEQINILEYFEFPYKTAQKLNINLFNKYIFKNIFGFIDIDININKQYKSRSGLYNYYFVGDIYGTLFIYSLLKAKEEEKIEEDKNIKIADSFDIENEDDKSTKINNISDKESKNKKKYIYNKTNSERIIFPIIPNYKK